MWMYTLSLSLSLSLSMYIYIYIYINTRPYVQLFVSRRLTYRELMDKMESVVINADTLKLKMELMLR